MSLFFSKLLFNYRTFFFHIFGFVAFAVSPQIAIASDHTKHHHHFEKLDLTPEEKKWLAKHPVIKLAVDRNWAPFEFLNANKRYDGMAADYMRYVESMLGIKFQVDKTRSWPEMVSAVKNRKLDAFSLVVQTPQRDEFVNFTNPYISFPMVIVSLENEPYLDGIEAVKGRKIAVVKSYASHEILAKNHKEEKLLLVPSVQKGLEAVSNGQSYAFIGNLAVISKVIREAGITNLKIAGQTPYRFELKMAVRKDWPELVPILQKALDAIPLKTRDHVYNKWIHVKFQKQIDTTIILALIFIASIIISLSLLWNNSLKKEIAQRQEVEGSLSEERARLSDIIWGTNIGTWEWSIATNHFIFNERWAELIGYSLDELEASDFKFYTKLIHKDDFKRANRTLKDHFAGKIDHYECSIRVKHKLGHWVWILDRAKIVERDIGGNPLRMSGTRSDITDIKNYEAQLEQLAHYDSLTGLPNRVLLSEKLEQAMKDIKEQNTMAAVLYIDLDGFKSVNDQYGHHCGDQLLVQVSSRMQEVLNEGDTLSRIGGDEFVAIITQQNNIEAFNLICNDILKSVSQPIIIDDNSLNVGASIGVAFTSVHNQLEPEQLLRRSDQAMYQSKVKGKNCVTHFDEQEDESVKIYYKEIKQAEIALQNDEFILHYQPKIDMSNGDVIGAEALIRWQHPEKGLLYPDSFQWLFKEHELIRELGDWVIKTALTQLESWHSQGLIIPISVNISPYHLRQDNFASNLAKLLAEYKDIQPEYLEIEIVETSEILECCTMVDNLKKCREMGVKVSLDDFGTGYSSIQHLRMFPVTTLKIDRSFIINILDTQDDAELVKAIIGLASVFKIPVIAEGVETKAHGELLMEMGCTLAQGYAISRPIPAEDWAAWILNWNLNPVWQEAPEPSEENVIPFREIN